MKGEHVLKRILCVIFILLCMTNIFMLSVFAEDTYGSVSVIFSHEDNPFSNVEFRIYHVANYRNGNYETVGQFSKYKFKFDEDTLLTTIAVQFKTYIEQDNILAISTLKTNENGNVVFDRLLTDNSIYLIVGNEIELNGKTYIPVPFFMSLPNNSKNDITAIVKYDIDEEQIITPPSENPNPPQTGDNSNIRFYIITMFISMIGFSLTIFFANKKIKN